MGIVRSRFERLFWESFFRSFVFARIVSASRKLSHSSVRLVIPYCSIPRPYAWLVRGQSIWAPPFVSRSPITTCCISAAK